MRLRELLYLNKSDRQVLLTLLSLAVIVLCVLYFTGRSDPSDESGESSPSGSASPLAEHSSSGDSLASSEGVATDSRDADSQPYYRQPERKVERFTFDPNTADSTALLRLGLRPWQVRNIYKYRAAGGIYRTKEDFAQLYGLTVKEYRSLEPYIRISADYQPASTLFKKRKETMPDSLPARPSFPRKLGEGETVDLNLSDTTVLKSIPGIGSYRARRIVEYGRRLGGYVSVDQLDEIDDVPPETKAYAIVAQPHPRQMPINRLTLNELKRHPYINFYQARAIIEYRRLHGRIGSLAELRLLPEFPPEAIERLEPYVSYE